MSVKAVRSLEQPKGPDEWIWQQLIDYIDQSAVIPIVGPGLLTIETAEGTKWYHAHVAELLAKKIGVPADALPAGDELNEVACRHLTKGGRIDQLYTELFDISKGDQTPVPEPLRQLASITPFQLFVTTTFSPLLERALNEVRFEGRQETQVLSYSLTKVQDLKENRADSDRPIVYHLFGKAAAIPVFAITHEDILEFIHALHSETRHPPNLYEELQDHSLLILGSRFSNWLARFFLRAARRERLMAGSKLPTFVADSEMSADRSLTVFLNHFSQNTRVFPTARPVEFVAELHQRWTALHPAVPSAPQGDNSFSRQDPFVFLSYASEDRAEVEKISEALTDARVKNFFDVQDLQAGENWAAKLRGRIRACSLFIPIISRNVLTIEPRYFREEWSQASERFRQSPAYYSQEDVFVLPVTIDGTPVDAKRIPPGFSIPQCYQLKGGVPTPEFVKYVKDLHRRIQQERAGAL